MLERLVHIKYGTEIRKNDDLKLKKTFNKVLINSSEPLNSRCI
jgi:hypothetical protein